MAVQLNKDTTLYELYFADDQVVIPEDQDHLEIMTRRLIKEYEQWGLIVSTTKTQYMCNGGINEELLLEDDMKINSCSEHILGNTIEQNLRESIKWEKDNRCILWSKTLCLWKRKCNFTTVFLRAWSYMAASVCR